MFIDLRGADDQTEWQADVCIVGGGAAGIAIAKELMGSRLRVLLIESGGIEFEPDTQELYTGENVGLEYASLDTARLRYWGGSTNHWEGKCGPLSPIDFEKRDWVPLSGWPMTFAELERFYPRAHEFLRIGPYVYDPMQWPTPFHRLNPFPSGTFEPEFFQFSNPPMRAGADHHVAFDEAGNAKVLLHANVTKIQLDAQGTGVRHLELATLTGRRATARARAVVLACGGIETPRLLLASNDVQANGVGNGTDWVGRCFMEHPEFPKAALGALRGDVRWAMAFSRWEHAPADSQMHLRTSDDLQRSEQILNTGVAILTVLPEKESSGYKALSRLRKGSESWGDMFRDMGYALIDPVDVVDGIFTKLTNDFYVPRLYGRPDIHVHVKMEQAPNPDSRVLLDSARDALGMPRVKLDWRLTELDRHTLATTVHRMAELIGNRAHGRLKIDKALLPGGEGWPEDFAWGYHHMGTTRMSETPQTGVVDANCKVHGVHGLYVAGSSVFPTGGYINPTLTLVALAIRLSDHLKKELA